jgi:hypothetical protein
MSIDPLTAEATIVTPPITGTITNEWWARRHSSTFARRYAWTSLALNVPILVGLVVWTATFWLVDGVALLGLTAVLLVAELVPGVVAIQLAIRAWRGEDVRHVLMLDALIRRFPTQPAS